MNFFSDSTSVEHLKKLKLKAQDAIDNPNDIMEYLDCLLTLFVAFYKSGFKLDDLIKSSFDKLENIKI